MPEGSKTKKKYITLKEAAHFSGYTADYLGQLIRKGKLPGKRIFLNEAWVTSEEDVRAYMASEGGGAAKRHGPAEEFFESGRYKDALAVLLYAGLALGILTIFFSFYVLASITDHAMEQQAVHAIQGPGASQQL